MKITMNKQSTALGIALFAMLMFSASSYAVIIGGIMENDTFDNNQDSEGRIVEIDNDGNFDYIIVEKTFETDTSPVEALRYGNFVASFLNNGTVRIEEQITNDTDFDWTGFEIAMGWEANTPDGLAFTSATGDLGTGAIGTTGFGPSNLITYTGAVGMGDTIDLEFLIDVTSDNGPVFWIIEQYPLLSSVTPPTDMPEPTTLALLGAALGLLGFRRRA